SAGELDPPGAGDPPATGGIERRLAELCEEEPVLELLERAELRQDVRLLVADELRPESRGVGELHRALVVARDRGARTFALLGHQPRELLVVDAEPAFARELLCQLEREAVRVVKAEGVLAGDVAAVLRDLLEQPQAARERLAEALLFGGEDAVDLGAMLLELGIALAHLLDHDVGEPREVRGFEADAPRLLDGASDDAAHDVAAALV